MIVDDTIPVLPRGVRLREDQARGGFTLMAPERVLKLDPIANEVLKRVDGTATVAAIVDDLARAFAADRAQIDQDVKSMLQGLADKRLLDLVAND
ncbi:MAG: pyrroloquinoline quinone biosynthesis peptide chaperone PqqD [Minwuia sp.]|nr:pyrroloquinoline quinone biosynthesis peptide chaperone PqqD [Minwuia sp.]